LSILMPSMTVLRGVRIGFSVMIGEVYPLRGSWVKLVLKFKRV
jgi:hypothetical protein